MTAKGQGQCVPQRSQVSTRLISQCLEGVVIACSPHDSILEAAR